MLAHSFEYRDHRYYFCRGNGLTYALYPEEAEKIAFQLSVVLALVVAGFAGWAGYSLYASAELLIDPAAKGSSWFLDSSVMYPAVIGYWMAAWSLSSATWMSLSWRLAGREPETEISAEGQSQIVKSTKPAHTFILGLFMFAFVAQAFGDICFLYRGMGHCEILTFSYS